LLLWLGNVVLVSILMLLPRRLWPILAAAAFVAFVLSNLQAGQSVRTIALLLLSDTVDVLTAALCLSYSFEGVPRLNSVTALAKFTNGNKTLHTVRRPHGGHKGEVQPT